MAASVLLLLLVVLTASLSPGVLSVGDQVAGPIQGQVPDFVPGLIQQQDGNQVDRPIQQEVADQVAEPIQEQVGDQVGKPIQEEVGDLIPGPEQEQDDNQVDRPIQLPVDGQWGSWGSWGPCSVTCGKHGWKIRTRACDNPAPANNGAFCPDSCAEAANCGSERCPGRVREDKTCQLSFGSVDTFGGVSGIFDYRCLFKAATLGPFKVAGGHKLQVDVYAACKDTDSSGSIFVSEVNIVVREICLHPSPRTSRFSINSQQINNVFNGVNQFKNAEDLWTVEDKDSYSNYLCFGYEDGLISFSMRKNKNSACRQVLTFMPLIPGARKMPSFVITVKENQLSKHHSVRFPNTLCSGRTDEAFEPPFKGLGTTEHKIMYALLDQNVEQPESDPQCSHAVRVFQQSSEVDKKEAVERCESINLRYLADCIANLNIP